MALHKPGMDEVRHAGALGRFVFIGKPVGKPTVIEIPLPVLSCAFIRYFIRPSPVSHKEVLEIVTTISLRFFWMTIVMQDLCREHSIPEQSILQLYKHYVTKIKK